MMATKNKIKEVYDFIATEYDNYMEETNHAKAQREIIELLKDEITGEAIDIGTGTGIIAITIAKKIPDSEVTAADISEKMIEEARKNARKAGVKIDFLIDDIEESNLPDNKFDIVICCLGMLWFINKEKALKEMARICKEKGKIILIEEEGEAVRSREDLQKFSQNLQTFFSQIEKLETPISIQEIKEKMTDLSFQLKREYRAPIDQDHGFVAMVFQSAC
jgi:ubiquinone/menaquinone biosynthesis C-methylase UbiE